MRSSGAKTEGRRDHAVENTEMNDKVQVRRGPEEDCGRPGGGADRAATTKPFVILQSRAGGGVQVRPNRRHPDDGRCRGYFDQPGRGRQHRRGGRERPAARARRGPRAAEGRAPVVVHAAAAASRSVTVEAVLHAPRHGLALERLELYIADSMPPHDKSMLSVLHEFLRELGVGIAPQTSSVDPPRQLPAQPSLRTLQDREGRLLRRHKLDVQASAGSIVGLGAQGLGMRLLLRVSNSAEQLEPRPHGPRKPRVTAEPVDAAEETERGAAPATAPTAPPAA